MGSIATTGGDAGQTGLAGGIRVSKASLRVDAYGTVDELNSSLGFARSICPDMQLADLARDIQRELFKVGSALATPLESPKPRVPITAEVTERLTAEVHRLEALDGILSDWSVPDAHSIAATFDFARTVCRRAERCTVRLVEAGEPVHPTVLSYLNRLSDLLWLFGRKLERDAASAVPCAPRPVRPATAGRAPGSADGDPLPRLTLRIPRGPCRGADRRQCRGGPCLAACARRTPAADSWRGDARRRAARADAAATDRATSVVPAAGHALRLRVHRRGHRRHGTPRASRAIRRRRRPRSRGRARCAGDVRPRRPADANDHATASGAPVFVFSMPTRAAEPAPRHGVDR